MTDIQVLLDKIKYKIPSEIDAETLEELRKSENLAPLLEMFHNPNYLIRTTVMYALIALGKPIIPVMLKELKAGNDFSRSGAADVLGSIGDSSVVPDLLIALKDEDYAVRREAAESLGLIGDPVAAPQLIEAMFAREEKESIFERAVYALQMIASEHDVPELHPLLNHDDPYIRLGAAYALEDKAGEAGIQGFIDLVDYGISGDKHEYEKAAECLSEIGKPAIPALIELLHHENEVLRRLAVQVLSTIGDSSALPAIIAMINDEDDVDVREDTVSGLGGFGTDALPILFEFILDEGQIGWCAYTALRWIGIPAVDGLFALLDQKDEKKSKWVAGTIGYIQIDSKNQDILNRLIQSLDDKSMNVQKGAVDALSRIRTPEALAAVEKWRRKQQNQS